MRVNDMQWKTSNSKDLQDINLHRFMEIHEHANPMEIAMELGISIGEVKQLKKRINRA
ncbi:hypothetical protein [Virgibacillus phasianinus]|uniref:hypothetical protein n=1 Tax=Virgibacillus phasianinus TaxID=2017483 RepID=UPI00155F8D3E|nr:hypothetical protein [Virgibacillus phasianinus]